MMALRSFSFFLTVALCFSLCSASNPLIYDDGNAILNHGLNPEIFHQFGTFSSRYTVLPKGPLYPPENCEIVQVTSLERHGSRHLSTGAHRSAVASLQTIQTAINQSTANPNQFSPLIQFLRSTTIDSTVEDLMPFGALQAWYSGLSTANVYEKLAKKKGSFIRSTGNNIPGQDRVLLTSKYWRLGFEGKPFPKGMETSNQTRSLASSIQPADIIFAENSLTNDTLSPSTCPGDSAAKPANISSDAQQALYANSTLLPTVGRRLESYFAKYNIQINITQSIITDLANLCLFQTFSTVSINNSHHPKITQSQFCELFDDKFDWPILGYYMNLGMYYQAGYGDPYHKALGTGFLRELLARLQNTLPPLDPPTSLNTTLDRINSPTTFPFQDGMIYMDTSHDGTMGSIASTIGLKRSHSKLTPNKHAEKEKYNWKFSEIAPMQGKIVFEKVHCKHHHHGNGKRLNGSGGGKHVKIKKYVRIRMNDQTQIVHKHWCPTFDDYEKQNHFCPLQSFLNNLNFVNQPNEWNKCYTNSITP